MATRTDPQFKPAAAPQAPEGEEPPRPRFEDRVQFEDLGKYEEITLPPHARLNWLSAELPSAPAELLQDTLPPNGSVKAPPKPALDTKSSPGAKPSDPASPVARPPKVAQPLAEPLTEQETLLVPRVRSKRDLRRIVALSMGAAALLMVIGIILSMTGPSGSDPPSAGGEQPMVAPQPVVALQPNADAAVATPKPALPKPALPMQAAPSSDPPARSSAAVPPSKPAADAKRDGQPKQRVKPAPATPSKPPASTNDFDLSKPFED